MSAAPAPAVLVLTLPDGATREVAPGTLARDVVATIGPRLLLAAIAVSIDGEVQDLMTPIRRGGAFQVITDKDPRALAVLRHSGAHILATAVRRLRPEAKIGFGPAIDDGFYYDFEVDKPFTPEDLEAFEAEMKKVTAEKYPFVREEVSQHEAKQVFVRRSAQARAARGLRRVGRDHLDVHRRPVHRSVPRPARPRHVVPQALQAALHTAGAYWRGDEKRQMLQRIYATAFFKKDELDAHLHRIEEAKKRDHRVLGKQLDLFQFFPHAPGAAFWTPKGTTSVNTLEASSASGSRRQFKEIKTPLLYNKKLWEQSGHWGKYKENMFLVWDSDGRDGPNRMRMSLKPMNCPSHHPVPRHKHSYRELPMRYVTFDVLHRNEISGALSGSRACASSRRTTATSICARTRSRAK
jgi:threonyl-tRNA synthetase